MDSGHCVGLEDFGYGVVCLNKERVDINIVSSFAVEVVFHCACVSILVWGGDGVASAVALVIDGFGGDHSI